MHHQTEFTLASPDLGFERLKNSQSDPRETFLNSFPQKWAEDRVLIRSLVEALSWLLRQDSNIVSARPRHINSLSLSPVQWWRGGSVRYQEALTIGVGGWVFKNLFCLGPGLIHIHQTFDRGVKRIEGGASSAPYQDHKAYFRGTTSNPFVPAVQPVGRGVRLKESKGILGGWAKIA